MDRNLPHSIWWERYYLQFFTGIIVDQQDPQHNFFARGPPRHSSPPVAHV